MQKQLTALLRKREEEEMNVADIRDQQLYAKFNKYHTSSGKRGFACGCTSGPAEKNTGRLEIGKNNQEQL